MGRALPTTMLWFLSLTLSLLVFANGTVTTFSLNLCHVKHSSVTGDGDWLERPPYLAATGKDSTVWSVSMPPTPPPPTGGWVGNGNVPYNGNPCAVERSNQGFIITSGAEGTIGNRYTIVGMSGASCVVWASNHNQLCLDGCPPSAECTGTVPSIFCVLFTSALFKPCRVERVYHCRLKLHLDCEFRQE